MSELVTTRGKGPVSAGVAAVFAVVLVVVFASVLAGVACDEAVESVAAAPAAVCALAAVEASTSEAASPAAVQPPPNRADCGRELKSECVNRPIGGPDGNRIVLASQ